MCAFFLLLREDFTASIPAGLLLLFGFLLFLCRLRAGRSRRMAKHLGTSNFPLLTKTLRVKACFISAPCFRAHRHHEALNGILFKAFRSDRIDAWSPATFRFTCPFDGEKVSGDVNPRAVLVSRTWLRPMAGVWYAARGSELLDRGKLGGCQ